MNKKKIILVSVSAGVIMIGAGVTYYCCPAAINNALGINSAGVDTILDGGASSSPAAIDPDADIAADVSTTVPQISAPAKKSAAKEKSATARAPASSGSLGNVAIAQNSSSSLSAASSMSAKSMATTTTSSIVSTLAPVPTLKSTSTSKSQSVSLLSSQNIALIETAPEHTSILEGTSSPSDSSMATSTSDVTSTTQVASTTAATTTAISTNSESNNNGASNDIDNSTSFNNNAHATTSVASTSSHVLIAAVQIAGASSSNDLVKLYNPTAGAIDMSGWKLHKKTGTGADYSLKVFPARNVIGAGQSFVWGNSENGFSEMVNADVSSTGTLAADNSVALMDAAGNIVDAVAWGTGANQYGEGPPYPTSPGANQSLSRRSSDGIMSDTGDNSSDFTIQ